MTQALIKLSVVPDAANEVAAPPVANVSVLTPAAAPVTVSTVAAAPRPGIQWSQLARQFAGWFLPPMFGLLLFGALWALVSQQSDGLPGPISTWHSAVALFSDPFYNNGPNDQGIGWNILSSLQRVGLGFGMAALIGIPLGFIIGRFQFMSRMVAPVISLLRPVSPLAWLPIGLLVFKAADPAAIWVIFISAIWPMIINTAVGVSKVPQDYMNVARVLKLSEWKIFTRILFPSVLPYMMTGVRLSIGVAWLVIVAAEMLTGGVGIGFWVWDEWNNLNVEHIIIAIFVVGIVGLLLEQGLLLIARRFSYE
ncbi:nitrate ABC transporter, permease protein [Pseudomethylobacillus aquaticus]|uniref:Nitrate ABC transporter, permease protein n=1 Tax=Pseudomethylobacillus aquaticus TaxID=2676064 RepID=A0A3N0V2Z8_9PROT|nr:nitrate ABC transporter permease [Pseudomethylobacillus aquaticus]ROH87176.1 nitrate ABC transporter, permease protein [Pseudomethylobacillus aquaticus]